MSELTKNTRVDLGDDLLETRTIPCGDRQSDRNSEPNPPPSESSLQTVPETTEELLLNAKILISEGLLEDAKKTLRRVLRMEPTSLAARDRLEEIQKIEIKKLLGQDENTGGGFLRAKKKKLEPGLEDGEMVATALERELGPEPGTEERFFTNEADRQVFLKNLELLCAGATPQDRIDLGIGFLEMEFYDVAIQMFRAALAAEPGERRARSLLATTWVARGNGFEAMAEIEALVADQSAPESERIDYGYLAGRAQELLQHFEMAVRWYRAVLQIEPGYRDAEDRMRRSIKMSSVKRVDGAPR
jgi:tetratricopeptide (TPR) repeat protein